MMNGMLELLGESLLATWTVIVFKIERDEFRPWKIFLGLRRVRVWLKLGEVVL